MARRSAKSKLQAAAALNIDGLSATIASLFDTLENVQFWIKDARGRYLWVNRAFLLNYSMERAEQVLGKTDFDLSPAYLADQYVSDDQRVLKGERINGRVELVGRFDHTASWSVTHKLPVKDARGRITGTVGITRLLSSRPAELDVHDASVSRSVSLIRKDCSAPWTNQALAKAANLSVRAFERRFQELFRVSPQRYIRQLRGRMACQTLVFTARTLAEIAAEFGYADQSHFTREFRRETSMTPGEYRKRFGGGRGARKI